jgi:hypothetical protein
LWAGEFGGDGEGGPRGRGLEGGGDGFLLRRELFCVFLEKKMIGRILFSLVTG